ncbi:alpha/beta fold hydrolase [Paenibacillus hodogayensis]|uniref:Alpha/beta fold hydrolase n=1 Tax=Paenibacillus hodogayensis TaxID=279208 RepID=A0ABV5W730_9BACL
MKPVWLWIHGWGMSPDVWGDPGVWLPEARHRLFSYEGCHTVDEMKERLREIVCEESLQGGPVHVLGWSLGGMLALELAMETGLGENKERLPIGQAVLIGASLRFVDERREIGWPGRVIRRMRTQLTADPAGTLLRFADSMLSPGERPTWPAVAERLAKRTDFTLAGLEAGLTYLLETDLTGRWERCSQAWAVEDVSEEIAMRDGAPEVIWMHGGEDPVCPPAALAVGPFRKTVLFPGAGHAPFVTQPERFAQQLRRIADGYR